MATALRSSAVLALRRAAAPASSSLSSAGRMRTRHYGNYDGSRSMFDAEAYSSKPVPANPELDKFDGFFTAAAVIGSFVVVCLMDGEGIGGHWFGWCKENNNTARQPRMSTGGGRRR